MRRMVYIARHGETEWNRVGRWQGHTDIPLNDLGRTQAAALAQRLAGLGIVQVHASDLSRARETAEIVARHLGIAGLGVDPDLRERGFGCFEGLTRDECMARFAEAWELYKGDSRQAPPDGEPQPAVIARMRAAVIRVAAALPAGAAPGGNGPEARALLVSHGGAIRSLVGSITGVIPPPLGNGALFQVTVIADELADATLL
jgi:broad specificity phosphatase PhoE